ncbi:uncharacterized protein LOC116416558 [Nasonia vitripennis]|uniref:Uncharacterized protein n=1 Tax=Nasonia vitripennis TaxID=7425 RepID=A0A7M7R383_NASVI|nr:uncharacterized protein LOC116416558 [Nasonia vitripennis]
MYAKRNLLNTPEEAEAHRRYKIFDEGKRIYLGQGITSRVDAWRTLRTTKPLSTFAAGAAQLIWKKELPYFCLDLKKVKKIVSGEKSIQLFCPNKLELFFGLCADYIHNTRSYKNYPIDKRQYLMNACTTALT